MKGNVTSSLQRLPVFHRPTLHHLPESCPLHIKAEDMKRSHYIRPLQKNNIFPSADISEYSGPPFERHTLCPTGLCASGHPLLIPYHQEALRQKENVCRPVRLTLRNFLRRVCCFCRMLNISWWFSQFKG